MKEIGIIGCMTALLAAMLSYKYNYSLLLDSDTRPINVPTEKLLKEYDFIVVGAGSAGKHFEDHDTSFRHFFAFFS